jgi:hypothetical protein
MCKNDNNIYKLYKVIRSDVYKNLEYISLLQSRATLAEPSKMHRNRPLAVHPAIVDSKIALDKSFC